MHNRFKIRWQRIQKRKLFKKLVVIHQRKLKNNIMQVEYLQFLYHDMIGKITLQMQFLQ